MWKNQNNVKFKRREIRKLTKHLNSIYTMKNYKQNENTKREVER